MSDDVSLSSSAVVWAALTDCHDSINTNAIMMRLLQMAILANIINARNVRCKVVRHNYWKMAFKKIKSMSTLKESRDNSDGTDQPDGGADWDTLLLVNIFGNRQKHSIIGHLYVSHSKAACH